MAGVIRPDRHEKVCRHCGGSFTRVKDPEYTHEVPRCDGCKKPPRSLLVRVTLPSIGKKDILHNLAGTRLKTLALADVFLTEVHEKIKNGTFDPTLYVSKKKRSPLNAGDWLEAWVKGKEKKIGSIGAAPATVVDTKGLIENYLKPFFGELDLSDIRYHHLTAFLLEDVEFFKDKMEEELVQSLSQIKDEEERTKLKIKEETRIRRFKGGEPMRHMALALLLVVMREAKKSYKSIDIPPLPPKEKTFRKRQQNMDLDERLKVLRHVKNHRGFFYAICAYTVRPSDMRALKEGDLDRKSDPKTVLFQRHFSRYTELPGRKSHQHPDDPFATLKLAFNPMFEAALKMVERKLDPNAFVFTVRTNSRTAKKYPSGAPLTEAVILHEWRRACKAAGVAYIPPYQASKHTNLSHLAKYLSPEDLLALSGNQNMKVVQDCYVKRDTVEISKRVGDNQQ